MTTKTTDYRKLSTELDDILAKLQGGELTIDEAVAAYKRGLELTNALQDYLKTAENTVTELKSKFDGK